MQFLRDVKVDINFMVYLRFSEISILELISVWVYE